MKHLSLRFCLAMPLFFGVACQHSKTDLMALQEEVAFQDRKIEALNERIAALQDEVKPQEIGDTDESEATAPEEELAGEESAPPASAAKLVGRESYYAGKSFKSKYLEALAKYEDGLYDEAIQILSTLENQQPANDLTDNCRYWLGECYFGKGQYGTAIKTLQELLAKYQDSNKIADTQYMIGKSFYKLGNNDRAVIELQRAADSALGTMTRKKALELIDQITKMSK